MELLLLHKRLTELRVRPKIHHRQMDPQKAPKDKRSPRSSSIPSPVSEAARDVVLETETDWTLRRAETGRDITGTGVTTETVTGIATITGVTTEISATTTAQTKSDGLLTVDTLGMTIVTTRTTATTGTSIIILHRLTTIPGNGTGTGVLTIIIMKNPERTGTVTGGGGGIPIMRSVAAQDACATTVGSLGCSMKRATAGRQKGWRDHLPGVTLHLDQHRTQMTMITRGRVNVGAKTVTTCRRPVTVKKQKRARKRRSQRIKTGATAGEWCCSCFSLYGDWCFVLQWIIINRLISSKTGSRCWIYCPVSHDTFFFSWKLWDRFRQIWHYKKEKEEKQEAVGQPEPRSQTEPQE